jgi:hypothetical protein
MPSNDPEIIVTSIEKCSKRNHGCTEIVAILGELSMMDQSRHPPQLPPSFFYPKKLAPYSQLRYRRAKSGVRSDEKVLSCHCLACEDKNIHTCTPSLALASCMKEQVCPNKSRFVQKRLAARPVLHPRARSGMTPPSYVQLEATVKTCGIIH